MILTTVSTCLVLAAVTFAPAAAHHAIARSIWMILAVVAAGHTLAHLLGGRGEASGKSRGRDGPGGDGDGRDRRASGTGSLPGWVGPRPVLIVVQIRKRTRKGKSDTLRLKPKACS
jgi:hypothetical protein